MPEIVSGEDQLDRVIRWVHSAEISDIARLLKGGELLLATGIGIGSGSANQRRFIRELTAAGAAALVLELGQAFAEVPVAMVEEARRASFPLIVLHREVRFVEVTEAIHREIVDHQAEAMRRGDEMHRRFFELMLEGAGVSEVLHSLAETVNNPVLLEKAGDGLLYHVSRGVDDATVVATWDGYARGIEYRGDVIEQAIRIWGVEHWGRLVVFDLNSSFDEHDRVAVERAVGVVALALLRDREEETVANRERGNFLATLLEREVDEGEATFRASSMGFRRKPGEQVISLAARASTRSFRALAAQRGSWSLIWRDVQRELFANGARLVAGTVEHERQLMMLIALGRGQSRTEVAARVAKLVREGFARHLGTPDGALVTVGPAATSWLEISESLRAASETLPAADGVPEREWHDASTPDLDRLLWSLGGGPELRRFVETRLAPLVAHDRNRRSKLLPTLIAYCEHGGRKTETALALHIERQSLYHRLKRIEELLEVDLSESDVLLGVALAVRARGYVESQSDGFHRAEVNGPLSYALRSRT